MFGHVTDESGVGRRCVAARAFLHAGRWRFRSEHYLGRRARHTGVKLTVAAGDSEDEILVFAGVNRAACVWIAAAHPLFRRLPGWPGYPGPGEMVTGVTAHGGAVWWEVWQRAHERTRGTPRWRNGNWQARDAVLGAWRLVSEEVTERADAVVPLPERSYPCTVTITRSVWARRLGRRTRCTYEVDMGAPVPIPGKGENSWDIDRDAIHGQSGEGRTVGEAIGNVVASAIDTRLRRGERIDYAERPAAGQ